MYKSPLSDKVLIQYAGLKLYTVKSGRYPCVVCGRLEQFFDTTWYVCDTDPLQLPYHRICCSDQCYQLLTINPLVYENVPSVPLHDEFGQYYLALR